MIGLCADHIDARPITSAVVAPAPEMIGFSANAQHLLHSSGNCSLIA